MQLLKKIIFVQILTTLISCSQISNHGYVEVIVVNNTEEVLNNIILESLSSHSHSPFKARIRESLTIDKLEINDTSKVFSTKILNLDCFSMNSDSKHLQIIDCMSNTIVKDGKYQITLKSHSIECLKL